ncbi:MAG: hypothetical protein GXP62_18795 [Oligoflexia bacterium]|nr:hypothetical protein [Oligoflexia bacterium]
MLPLLLMLATACTSGPNLPDKPVHGGDGGATDAGSTDGGATDAGTTDGGGPDGGCGDGGTHDGGGSDSGSDGGGTTSPLVAGLTLTLDDNVLTMVNATWKTKKGEDAWVEYRCEGKDWLSAPARDLGDAVLLGIASETDVEARLAMDVGGETLHGASSTITTGSLPDGLPLPTIDAWNEALADPAGFAMISVAGGDYTFEPPYWIEIFDRQGRVVWYQQVTHSMFSFYPTVSLDGTHIWYDSENIFGTGTATASIMRQTLDGRWSASVAVPGMGEAAGEGPDGSFYYELRTGDEYALNQVSVDGVTSQVWDCAAWMVKHSRDAYYCSMNTTIWSDEHNSVLASMFYINTVFEIDLGSGEPIRQFGQLTVGDPWDFSPPESVFDYQHYVYWLDADTLIASTHDVDEYGVQMAAEYHVDDATQTLTRTWSYQSTDLWATQMGEAIRLPNGNTMQGYGQDGAVREVTPDGETVWQASWDKDYQGYRVVGHLSLIDDLYALNQGWE